MKRDPQPMARDVVNVLDNYCSDQNSVERVQFKKHAKVFNQACVVRDVARTLDETRLVMLESRSVIGQKLDRLRETAEEFNQPLSREINSFIDDFKADQKRLSRSVTTARNDAIAQRRAIETDIKNLEFKGGQLDTFFKKKRIERKRLDELKGVRCKERTRNQLLLTCKEENVTGCGKYKKNELINIICK